MTLIDGKRIAGKIQENLSASISNQGGRLPCLAMILVGEHPSSQIYVQRKAAACKQIGMESRIYRFPPTLTEAELILEICHLNLLPEVDGILVQLPLPPTISPEKIMLAIDPSKDVDGFHPINMGRLLSGDTSGFVPCTPLGIQRLLTESSIDPAGKHMVILGRSTIVGKPLAALMMQKAPGANATVTVAHSQSNQLTALCRQADILVAAIGQPHFVKAEMIKEGAVVIDVGINKIGNRIVGDVDFNEVEPKCSQITPVPGGVGPMTIAMLLSNTLKSYIQR